MRTTTIYRALSLALPGLLLSGCYILPVGSDGVDKLVRIMEQTQAAQLASAQNAPAPAAGPSAPIHLKTSAAGTSAPPAPVMPMTLQARLYPTNDIATDVGMVSGTVTNMMNGKGRVQLSYRGEIMTGEATRVVGEERKGMANAWGANGSFMSCEYQMSAPVRGAGTCIFSDGARYQVHVGN